MNSVVVGNTEDDQFVRVDIKSFDELKHSEQWLVLTKD